MPDIFSSIKEFESNYPDLVDKLVDLYIKEYKTKTFSELYTIIFTKDELGDNKNVATAFEYLKLLAKGASKTHKTNYYLDDLTITNNGGIISISHEREKNLGTLDLNKIDYIFGSKRIKHYLTKFKSKQIASTPIAQTSTQATANDGIKVPKLIQPSTTTQLLQKNTAPEPISRSKKTGESRNKRPRTKDIAPTRPKRHEPNQDDDLYEQNCMFGVRSNFSSYNN